MLNQEEKEYREFIEKFLRSVFELKSDLEKLSKNNKVRVREYIVNSAETRTQFEILKLIANRL
jgi:translation initiation factor 2 beta subunit (eIF-2beta)/eIF-5